MTDFLKIAKSIAVHFAHICAYGVETVKLDIYLRQAFIFYFSPKRVCIVWWQTVY